MLYAFYSMPLAREVMLQYSSHSQMLNALAACTCMPTPAASYHIFLATFLHGQFTDTDGRSCMLAIVLSLDQSLL